MPLAIDTAEVFAYVFSTDRAKENPPALLFNFPSCREAREIANLFDKAQSAATVDEFYALRLAAVQVKLIGWRGFPVPYAPDAVSSVLSDGDMTELQARLLKEMLATEVEKKASAFFALSNLVASAPAVAPENASVPSSPPSSNA